MLKLRQDEWWARKIPCYMPSVLSEINQICDWLPRRARYMSYWPSVRSRRLDVGQVQFLARIWTEMECHKPATSKKTKQNKKNQGQYPGQYPAILTEQACSIRDSLYGKKFLFSCRTRRVIPSEHNSSTRSLSGSQLQRRIRVIVLARGLCPRPQAYNFIV